MAIYFGQTITEKLSQADDYFAAGNHIRYLDWGKYEDDEKKAGLLQAEREVNLYLGLNYSLEDMYSETSFPISHCANFRPDYAVFEHALFILDNTARTNTSSTGFKMIESESYQEEERDTGVPLAPQASRFLQMNRIAIERG